MSTIAHIPPTGQPPLALEAALASRIIRSGRLPRELFQWLASPDQCSACGAELTNERLTAALNEVLAPLMADACQWQRREARDAAQWIGAVCLAAAHHYEQLKLGVGPRLLAASLLPLYRCLGTGQLSEGLSEARFRLSETLTLLALCHEVGKDLVQLLDPLNRRMEAPNHIMSAHFDLDLVLIAQVVREQHDSFDPTTLQFNAQGTGELMRFDRQQAEPKVVEWAAPELLWRLSGELISKNSELVLPRAWVESPVPWNSIADHWNKLSLLLTNHSCKQPQTLDTHPCATSQPTDDGEALTLASLTDLTSLLDTASSPSKTSTTTTTTTGAASRVNGLPTSDLPLDQRAASRTSSADLTTTRSAVAHVIPKVIIAEIRSHNDPVFVNVIRRQIAKCRGEERAISLISMVVLPEDGNDHHEVHENGLTLWQQRLVNWLADHPQVVEPHAFLTSEGELLLCLLDLERNETTSLIRHGLVEVLTGKQLDDSQGNPLAKVNVPARYHAGISSTSSPGAGFTAEQLIEPAVLCLSAASRHGKASIKSKEVY